MCAVVENVQLLAGICAVVKTGSALEKFTFTVVSQKTVSVNQAFHRISDKNSDNVQLQVYLADTLAVFSRYQKQRQSDSTTILDVDSLTTNVRLKLGSLKDTALLGG